MKKIFLIIFLFLGYLKVSALEYGEWTEEVSTNSSDEVINSEIRYKWYTESKVKSDDYYLMAANDPLYPYVDLSDTKEEWSEWSLEYPSENEGRIVEGGQFIRYRSLKPIRYLYLNNFYDDDGKYSISELDILIDGKEIYPNIICNECSVDFEHFVNDGVLDDRTYVKTDGNVMIDLGGYYRIDQISLMFFLYNSSPSLVSFDLYFSGEENIIDMWYAKRRIGFPVSYNSYEYPEIYFIFADMYFTFNKEAYTDWSYIPEYFSPNYYEEVEVFEGYRFKDIKYRYYSIEKEYVDGYYKDAPGDSYIKDETSAKTFYVYEKEDYKNDISEDVIDNEAVCVEVVNNANFSFENEANNEMPVNNIDNVPMIENINEQGMPEITSEGTWTDDKGVKSFPIGIAVLDSLAIAIYRIRKHILSHQK